MNWDSWMSRAVELASQPTAPRGENPRVGCVIVDESGAVVGEGWHLGAGTAHAEVVALRQAGDRAAGGTAVVTLEPCRHYGRTGPCVQALIDAGVSCVVFGQSDPTDEAGGGAQVLADAGIEVVRGVLEDQAAAINREWSVAVSRGRPFVTAKCAVSLDGRVAGHDGARVALTGTTANRYTHELRARVQAIVVGARTVIIDDPELTVRHAEVPINGQPLRVVVGERHLPADARIFDTSAPSLHIRDRDPAIVLSDLYARGARHVLLEGGPTLLRAFLEAGFIDELVWLVAGVWLGTGPRALPDGSRMDLPTHVIESRALGQDVLMRMTVMSVAA